jgi:flagellar basal-body rod protein FlgB
MLNGIGVFHLASTRMSYETAGLRVVARNIANADTPGFRGTAVVPFEETVRRQRQDGADFSAKATRTGHAIAVGRAADGGLRTEQAEVLEEAPNGNTVALEDEMIQAARLRGGHALAATTFEKNLELMRMAVTAQG